MAAPKVFAVCYVDFTSNLDEGACGRSIGELLDVADDTPPSVTVYMSSATCPGCRAVIDAKLATRFPPQFEGADSLIAGSTTSVRMRSSSSPAPRSIEIP